MSGQKVSRAKLLALRKVDPLNTRASHSRSLIRRRQPGPLAAQHQGRGRRTCRASFAFDRQWSPSDLVSERASERVGELVPFRVA